MPRKTKTIKESAIDRKIRQYWKPAAFIAAVIVIVALIAILPAYLNFGKVKYAGMTFQTEKFGSIIVYHYSYLLKTPSGNVAEYNLYLRNNPAKNNVRVEGDRIVFPEGETALIGLDASYLIKCNQSSIAVPSLTQFLINNFIKVKGGTTSRNESIENNMSYVECNEQRGNPTIIIEAGNETKVSNKGNCHRIKVANCEVLPAVEKFIVQAIIDAREQND
jgi:hypothetical protein